ncbi:MAG TPA: DUF3604 domain-containing protein [Steroidobacter sp.]|uniref:DUF3604 domain-containing protein n=1 Tax=Steroidobacter sp. TaxID=1978227 RepID=UPI002ED81EDD
MMNRNLALGNLGAAVVLASIFTVATAAENNSRVAPDQRRVLYGELHLHTSLSVDAWGYSTKLLPADAYRFGRGETVMVPATQVAKAQGLAAEKDVAAKRAWPLDFMAVTDHSESVGTLSPLENPNSSFATSDVGKQILANPALAQRLKIQARKDRNALPPEMRDATVMSRAWDLTVKAANDHYAPGKFTTFIGYEWSALPDGKNLHRNVIFNADRAPLPFTADESSRPEDLWSYLESVRARGTDVIAIPHNANASGGLMFDWNMSDGKPIDEAYALRRALNEPLAEIVQIKGSSDTLPVLSPNDEFASFEIFDKLLGPAGIPGTPPGSYIRDAFGRGLVIQSRTGANPFKYGLVGSSDIHNGLSTSDESASAGGQSGIDPATMLPRGEQARRSLGMREPDAANAQAPTHASEVQRMAIVERSSGGLTGVWAEENTRDSIFAALKRKETFATSGPRIRVRMFAGWKFDRDMLNHKQWVRQAYAHGVPMGADLPVKPASASAPRFLVQAAKDPEGANLDRIQIIKVWLEGSQHREKIFDVALSGGRKIDPATRRAPPVGSTVDLQTGEYQNRIGAPVLESVWTDPEFDAGKPAVYYARVLEIPTPRWSTLLAVKNDLPIPSDVPPSIQERAWSSPIWFSP